jgi:UDP-N-acetyl-D-mannosaminuronic acid transferase (WecB/TagA/CpsF family)
MNAWILLGLLLVAVVGTLAACVPLGLHALRLYRTGRRAQRELLPLVEGLARRADVAATKATALGDKGQVLSERLAELQRTVARVAVLGQALQTATAPWRRLRRYLT